LEEFAFGQPFLLALDMLALARTNTDAMKKPAIGKNRLERFI
jgi:hypothetical protein